MEIDGAEATPKFCRGCHRDLPRSGFWRQTRSADGLMRRCKDCSRTYLKNWYAARQLKIVRVVGELKLCTTCDRQLPTSEFWRDKRARSGLMGDCKVCSQTRVQRWHDAKRLRIVQGAEKQIPIPEFKGCSSCGRILPRDNFGYNLRSALLLSSHCKQCIRIRGRAWYDQLRHEVIYSYGGKCACCGERQFPFLTIDHIGGGGAKHKREIGGKTHQLYSWLKRKGFPDGFRVLCMNCNWATAYGRICPHQQKEKT